jgi:hypothetical protein
LILFATATNSNCVSNNPERLIRNLAKPDYSPLRGGPAAVQNAMRFVELPTKWFEATYSIQLSYGCITLSAGIIQYKVEGQQRSFALLPLMIN